MLKVHALKDWYHNIGTAGKAVQDWDELYFFLYITRIENDTFHMNIDVFFSYLGINVYLTLIFNFSFQCLIAGVEILYSCCLLGRVLRFD